MRLSNRRKAGFYNVVYLLLIMVLFGGVFLFLISDRRGNFLGIDSYLFLVIPAVLIVGFYLRGRQIFEYDSDGEVLNFRNRDVVPYFQKELHDEFPKYKVLNYELVNAVIMKRLYITLTRKTGQPVILKYDISYLSKKEMRILKFSLGRVLIANKEVKSQNCKPL